GVTRRPTGIATRRPGRAASVHFPAAGRPRSECGRAVRPTSRQPGNRTRRFEKMDRPPLATTILMPPPKDPMTPDSDIRLTRLAKRTGCAAKHPPGFLLPLLGLLPAVTDPNVLVGSSTADDAAVY